MVSHSSARPAADLLARNECCGHAKLYKPHVVRITPSRLIVAAATGSMALLGINITYAQPPGNPAALAQQELPGPALHSLPNNAGRLAVEQYGGTEALLKTAVSNIFPGGISTQPFIQNPVANDVAAPLRGMQYFNAFNCVGCHAANGGGGIGPALSNRFFKYGSAPADIYLTIVQGRPNGMPSWGGILPDPVIWDLVAYVTQISQAPQDEWGQTVSLKALTIEQVPAEFETTANPWAHTEPFSFGQKPSGPKQQAK